VLARQVFIGSMVVYMDYVLGVGSRQITDKGIGSHAALQGYNAPHYTFTMHGQPYFSTCEATVYSMALLMAYSAEYSMNLPAYSYCFTCDFNKSNLFTDKKLDYYYYTCIIEFILFRSVYRVQALEHRLGAAGYISSVDDFSFGCSYSLFQNSKRLRG
jgi:hypothetical protein